MGLPALVAVALLGGCTERLTQDEADPIQRADLRPARAAAPDLQPPQVSGSAVDVYVLESGEVRVPRDLSGVTIAALVPDGQGGYESRPGAGLADGTFRVPDVPDGPYYLHFDTIYLWTRARTLDLGVDHQGRPDKVLATSQTYVTFQISGLTPWQQGDGLQLMSTQGDTWTPALQDQLATLPTPGTTQMKDLRFDWRVGVIHPTLLDPARGDQLYVSQLSTRTSDKGLAYQAISRARLLTGVALYDGQPATLRVELADVPQAGSLSLRVRMERFRALRTAVNPYAQLHGAHFYLDEAPGAGSRGLYAHTADLISAALPTDQDVLETGTLRYGSPFPGSWERYGDLSVRYRVSYTAPGATHAYYYYALIGIQAAPDELSQAPVAPRIQPVQGLTVAGRSAQMDQRGIGTSPTLAFAMPAGAALWRMEIHNLANVGGRTRRSTAAVIYGRDDRITLLPDLLQAGQAYFIAIYALAVGGAEVGDAEDRTARPFRRGLPYAMAGATSGILVP